MARPIVTFWRLDGANAEVVTAPAKLALGLRRHLAYSELVVVLVQVGRQQQAYVRVHGCPRCAAAGHHQGCGIGCFGALFARLVQTSAPGITLRAVPRGLAPRPYTRAFASWPGATAVVLDGALLAPWPEARLVIAWQQTPATTDALPVGGFLAVGPAGPDPAAVLATHGWQACPLPRWQHGPARAPVPGVLRQRAHWHAAPWLVLPAAPDQGNIPPEVVLPDTLSPWQPTPGPSQPRVNAEALMAQATTPLARLLTRALIAAQAPPARPAEDAAGGATATESPEPSAESIWPHGPGMLQPTRLGAVLERVLADPLFTSGADPGVTKNRLRHAGAGADAEALLVWLDAAGVLAAPSKDDPIVRWREARPLQSSEPTWLAARLQATPLPEASAVDAVRAVFSGRPTTP